MSLRTKAVKTDAKKLTAAQVKKSADEPKQRGTIGELHNIGRQIQVKVEILNHLGGKAVDMKDSIDHLLADAEKLCDRGGFEAFKKHYCQGLGQSRTYELLAIQQGRKTVEDIRAATRRRVAEHRAAKRNVTKSDSVTADPADSATEPPGIRLGGGQALDIESFSPAARAQLAEKLSPVTDKAQIDLGDAFEEGLGWFDGDIFAMPVKIFCGRVSSSHLRMIADFLLRIADEQAKEEGSNPAARDEQDAAERKRIDWEASHPEEAKAKALKQAQDEAIKGMSEHDLKQLKDEAKDDHVPWKEIKDEKFAEWLADNWEGSTAEEDFEQGFNATWAWEHGTPHPADAEGKLFNIIKAADGPYEITNADLDAAYRLEQDKRIQLERSGSKLFASAIWTKVGVTPAYSKEPA